MKKIILAIATVIALTAGNSFAQRPYGRHEIPAAENSRIDDINENIRISKLNEIVNLSRKQEKQLKRIKDHYDRLQSSNRRYNSHRDFRRLETRKQQEILSVLTPVQRQRLYAYQHANRLDSKYRSRRG
ncbi:hypothetical protein [Dyadobacter sediminis]|uniref:Periplasmic heavy metal sensor n=1 Tax=Dyadobacter sediminis TaxID=1493691 RepID=A0A5R9KA41_9BACT|nr:hypothetical protein [Dyadobacter sediminis]TLU91701.1 hypothetical protein FEM55_13020 [Dyadobacter sediminis]GGC01055.1 hypothetical protein GCM10011325_30310 [Dyadobacter sediminis]